MKDLIDRQAALKAIKDLYPGMPRIDFGDNISNWQQKYSQYIECENVIRSLPSAERKGHWIYGEDEYGIDGYHCDECGFFVPWDYAHNFINFIEDYHYCPNCGARMDGEQ